MFFDENQFSAESNEITKPFSKNYELFFSEMKKIVKSDKTKISHYFQGSKGLTTYYLTELKKSK